MIHLDEFVAKVDKGDCIFPEFVAIAEKDEQNVISGQKVYLDCQICNNGEHNELIQVFAYDSEDKTNIVWQHECDTSCGYTFPFQKITG